MGEQIHAGKYKGIGKSVWHAEKHSEGGEIYWSGFTGYRSPVELYLECTSIINDLKKNHPNIFEELEDE